MTLEGVDRTGQEDVEDNVIHVIRHPICSSKSDDGAANDGNGGVDIFIRDFV